MQLEIITIYFVKVDTKILFLGQNISNIKYNIKL